MNNKYYKKSYNISYRKNTKIYSIRYKADNGEWTSKKFTQYEEAVKFRDEMLNKPTLELTERTWQEKVLDELLSKMPQGEKWELDYSEIDKATISNLEYMIKTLTPREEHTLIIYYSGMTLEECGKHLEVTKERVRQIIVKALLRLYHRRFAIFTKLDVAKYQKEIMQEIDKKIQELEELKKMPIEEFAKDYEVPVVHLKLEDLDFSVRTYNGLRRVNILTVGDIISKTEDEMMKVRNLGRKSLKEIKNIIHDLGLTLKEENTELECAEEKDA